MTIYGQFLSPEIFYNSKIDCYVKIKCLNFATKRKYLEKK